MTDTAPAVPTAPTPPPLPQTDESVAKALPPGLLADVPETGADAIPLDLLPWLQDQGAKFGFTADNLPNGLPPGETTPVPGATAGESTDPAVAPGSLSLLPEGDATQTAPVGDGSAPPAAEVPSITVDLGNGQTLAFTEAQAREYLQLQDFVQSRADIWPVAQGIERGEVVPLSRQDYEALIAYVERTSATPPAAPAPAPAPTPARSPRIDPNTAYDSELARAFNEQADRIDQLTALLQGGQQLQQQPRQEATIAPFTPPAPVYTPPTPEAVYAAQQANQNLQLVNDALADYSTRFGLTEQEGLRMAQIAAESGDVTRLIELQRAHSPHLPLDMGAVYRQAFDRALVTDPSLRARYEQTLRSTPAAPPVAPTGDATNPADTASLNAKKARSASLASVPSAATPTPTRDPRQMSDRDLQAAVAEQIRIAMGQPA